jgi:NADH dehydrogenase (ubiquinone) 1 beta subcomplex subunit 10
MSDDRATELKGLSFYRYSPSTHTNTFCFSARVAARDAHIRESWVRAMEARIVRDQLQSCYRAEGVNHYETCRELSEKYITLLKENRVSLRFLPWKLLVVHQCIHQVKGYKQVDV